MRTLWQDSQIIASSLLKYIGARDSKWLYALSSHEGFKVYVTLLVYCNIYEKSLTSRLHKTIMAHSRSHYTEPLNVTVVIAENVVYAMQDCIKQAQGTSACNDLDRNLLECSSGTFFKEAQRRLKNADLSCGDVIC